MIECGEQFVDSRWAERIANLWTIERDTYRSMCLGSVIRDVVKRKTFNFVPLCWVKNVRYVLCAHALSVSPATSVFARCALGIAQESARPTPYLLSRLVSWFVVREPHQWAFQ